MKKQLVFLTGLIVIASMILSACGGPAPAPATEPPAAPAAFCELRRIAGRAGAGRPRRLGAQDPGRRGRRPGERRGRG